LSTVKATRGISINCNWMIHRFVLLMFGAQREQFSLQNDFHSCNQRLTTSHSCSRTPSAAPFARFILASRSNASSTKASRVAFIMPSALEMKLKPSALHFADEKVSESSLELSSVFSLHRTIDYLITRR
jgi:hypothetical protein